MSNKEISDALLDRVKEKGIVDIILSYKHDMETVELNNMRMKMFDMRFTRKMPYYTRDDLYNIWGDANSSISRYDQKKYNIHDIYHRLRNIENEIEKLNEIDRLAILIQDQENYMMLFLDD